MYVQQIQVERVPDYRGLGSEELHYIFTDTYLLAVEQISRGGG